MLLALPGLAKAHPDVDAAIAAYQSAEFEAALAAFERAERRTDLTREDLLQLLENRTLVSSAMQNQAAVEADLVRLAILDPEHQFSRQVPPDIRALFAELRADAPPMPRLEITATPREDGVTVEAHARGDTARLVRQVRLHGRRAGTEDWIEATGEPLELAAARGDELEVWGELLGPGGVVLASEHSADAPRLVAMPTPVDEAAVTDDGDDGGGGSVLLWAGIAGAAAVVLLTVGIAVGVSKGGGTSQQTRVTLPDLSGEGAR